MSNTAAPGALDLTWSVDVVENCGAPGQPQAPAARDRPKGSTEADGTGAAAFGLGGPDAFGYTWVDSDETQRPAVDFQDISGTGTAVTFTGTGGYPGPDEGYADVVLPVLVPVLRVDRTSVRVFSNGFAHLQALTGTTFTTAPSRTRPRRTP